MLNFPDFTDIKHLYDEEDSSYYSAKKDDEDFIIKYLTKPRPANADLIQYQYEYELLKNTDDENFVKALDFQLFGESCFLVYKSTHMKSLDKLLRNLSLSFDDKLHISKKMCILLESLQKNNIIHKAVTLSNILYDLQNNAIRLKNFSSSITLSSEQHLFQNPHAQKGDLYYFSPEQTGRMNRHIDYRSDLYSFGICLYKLFCGQFPFEQNNKVELFHTIIAIQAVHPIKIEPSIPTLLSDIIIKLIQKNAEDRYQSPHGLTSDISAFIESYKTDKDPKFILGKYDHTGVLHIPQKLFGRENEIKTLLNSFKRVSNGAKEILLVSGYSGVGKSVLVNEVHKPITKSHGFFIEGKFDQFQKDKPYFAIIQAFNSWIEHILDEPRQERQEWKDTLVKILGRNTQVIIDLIPAFEGLLGEQAPAEELSGIEAQNRFNYLFSSLIRVIASKEHPLVIFLDDLQWSDQATLNLIQILYQDAQSSYFLLFGAYRDNEVDETHPLLKSVMQMKKEETVINTLHIDNLTQEDVYQLLSQTLQQDKTELTELVELIYNKTSGNAFFVNSFISALNNEGLLYFDFDMHKWNWDIEAIHKKNITDNVVDLMSKEISKLSLKTQTALTLAACIGNRFDLKTLSIISEKTTKETAQDLNDALKHDLIIPQKDTYKYIDYDSDDQQVSYRFSHDRIQQAAYSFLSEKERPKIHLHIGQLLQDDTEEDNVDEKLFDIVNHINIGESLVTDSAQRKSLAKLNFQAAQKAQKAIAYEASYGFLSYCLNYMDEQHWKNDYALSYDAYLLRSEIAYMVQDFSMSKQLIDEILEYANTGVERAKAQNVSVLRETMQGNYLEAIEYGRDGMAQAGFSLPDTEYDENFGKDLQEINTYLQEHTISSLGELPVCRDESVIVATAILMNMGPPTYMAFKPLYPIVCSRFVLLAIENGNTLYSSIAYSNYGIVLAAMMGQYDAGYEFGLVSLKVGKDFKNMQQVCKNSFMFATILNNWVHPIKMGAQINEEGYQVGMQSGDLQFVGYILYSKLLLSFIQGDSLDDIKEKLPYAYRYQENTQNKWALDNIGALSFAIYKLKGEESPLCSEKDYLHSVSTEEGQSGLCFYKIFMAQVEFLFKNYGTSLQLTQEAEEIMFNIYGFLPVLDNNFYSSLSLSMLALAKPADERDEEIKGIQKNQEQLQVWSDKVNENFLHKYLFVQAQLAWIKGHNEEARTLYNTALDSAIQNNFYQDLAIINEYYGLFLHENDTQKVAMLYLNEALYYYERWSADAKVKELKDFIIDQFHTIDSSSRQNIEQIDYNSIIKSIHLISSEVELSSLITNYVTISMQNSGAQKAVLLMPKENELEIVLQKSSDDSNNTLVHRALKDFAKDELLIHPLIEKVYNSLQAVILDDASSDSSYSQTDYVLKNKPLSVLVLPVIHNDSLEAILYLENSLIKDLFSVERLEILSILGAQVGISFENARLYRDLEYKVQERTKELQESNTHLSDAIDKLTRTQTQLVESEKNASLGRLVAGVAHEINTPIGICITGITSITHLINSMNEQYEKSTLTKSSYETFLNDSMEFTNLITKNLQRAAKLIQNFKKVSVDQTNERLEDFALSEFLEELLLGFRGQFERENVSIDVGCDKELRINSYAGPLYQILTNLINNTMLHAFDGSTSKHISIEVKEAASTIIINFCDNGKGIPESNISKIFDPFFTTKMGSGGTGLGLHIIYNIITQQLQGTISVSSEPNQTCFSITLPKSIQK